MTASFESRAPADAPVIVGRITAPHGVRGWFKLRSHMRPHEEILQYSRWLLSPPGARNWRSVEVAETRAQSRQMLGKLAGVDTRDAAAELTGEQIAVRGSQLAKLPAGEYYWSELIGMKVVNRDGEFLGTVDHLIETGANDVLALRYDDARGERLLPWGESVINEVDVAARKIYVDWNAED